MKSMITVLVLSIVSATAAMADGQFTCSTAPNKYNGVTSITVTETDADTAVLKGFVNGGMAHFIRGISPVNMTVTHEVDMTTYSNSEEGTELTVVTMGVAGQLITTATFKEGTEFPSVSMTCQFE